jgi:DNA-directed RNA polymerase subunit RPC12/RpoP
VVGSQFVVGWGKVLSNQPKLRLTGSLCFCGARWHKSHSFLLARMLLIVDKSLEGGDLMPKCGLCGSEVKEQPKITAGGKCSVCGTSLATTKSYHRVKSKQ